MKEADMPFVIGDSTDNDLLFPTDHARGAVPRDYSVQPVEMLAPPTEMPLVPRSEWSARCKELKDRKARTTDLRQAGIGKRVPALDQGQVGYSHTADTEVLTERGWVPWPEYDGTTRLASIDPLTHLLEFQAPT